MGFDDMGYDKGFGGGNLGFCLIFVGNFDDWKGWIFNNIKNLSWCVDKSA